MSWRDSRGAWPGLDFAGMTLADIRRRVRGKEGGESVSPPPSREPERIGDILQRMGFGKGWSDERSE